MPQLQPDRLGAPIEVCAVRAFDQVPGADGATTLFVELDTPRPSLVQEIVVPAGQLAVVRFAPCPETGETDGVERVEFIGGGPESFDEICFAAPGRHGGLRVLNRERAHTEAVYLGQGLERLRWIRQATGQAAERVMTLALARRSIRDGTRDRAAGNLRVLGMLAERQLRVIDAIPTAAALDHMTGVFDPRFGGPRSRRHRSGVVDQAA